LNIDKNCGTFDDIGFSGLLRHNKTTLFSRFKKEIKAKKR